MKSNFTKKKATEQVKNPVVRPSPWDCTGAGQNWTCHNGYHGLLKLIAQERCDKRLKRTALKQNTRCRQTVSLKMETANPVPLKCKC